jgi:hypothetical protein
VACATTHTHGASSSASAGSASASAGFGGASSSASASAGGRPGRRFEGDDQAPALLKAAYAKGKTRTRDAIRAGLMLAIAGAAFVGASLILSSRAFYFLAILAVLLWCVAGYVSGSRARGFMSGLWSGLVTGATAGVVTFITSLLVHGGRLALFGTDSYVKSLVNTGPVSAFFGPASPASVEGAVTGAAYMLYIAAFFAFVSVGGTVLAAVAGGVAGSMSHDDDANDSTESETTSGDRGEEGGTS